MVYTPQPESHSNPMHEAGLALLKVIGAGGGGCNAVSRMVEEKLDGVQYIGVNTDAQHLGRCDIPQKITIGTKITRGLGAGGNPELGREAAEESREDLYELLRDSDMVFIAAGMGGGTGTGSTPVLAEISKETGALTVAVVTKPFSFEGTKRKEKAEAGILALRSKVDTLLVISNDKLLRLCDANVTMEEAFHMADDVLHQGVEAIAGIITSAGEVNRDFADVKSIMKDAGPAWMAIGHGEGENRAVDAARAAVASPLLDSSIEGAKGVLFNITGGKNLTLQEVNAASDVIRELVDPEANILFGMDTDARMDDGVMVTIIATGFPPTEDDYDDDEYTQLLLQPTKITSNGAVEEEDEDLDIPPFLRRFSGLRRHGRLS
jgi:cell division protein FtsZ